MKKENVNLKQQNAKMCKDNQELQTRVAHIEQIIIQLSSSITNISQQFKGESKCNKDLESAASKRESV